MSVEYKIISIGTLSHNLIWNESRPVRTQHATTTLITCEDKLILVDPALPPQILEAKFFERTGQPLANVTDVFCTTLRPDSRRAIEALGNANWWASETELEWYGQQLVALEDSAQRMNPDEAENIEKELELLRRFKPAPEKFTEQVSLYPLDGPTPGCAGLLLTPPTNTVIIAGPAVATSEHLSRGMVWDECNDTEAAMETFKDILELADLIIPGFDNVCFSPGRWM